MPGMRDQLLELVCLNLIDNLGPLTMRDLLSAFGTPARVLSASRSDLMALTEESAQVTGIPYVMNAYREEAYDILDDVGSFEREGGVIPLGEPTAVLRILREGARRQRSSRLS